MYDMDILQAELETCITHMSNVALCLDRALCATTQLQQQIKFVSQK